MLLGSAHDIALFSLSIYSQTSNCEMPNECLELFQTLFIIFISLSLSPSLVKNVCCFMIETSIGQDLMMMKQKYQLCQSIDLFRGEKGRCNNKRHQERERILLKGGDKKSENV